MSSLVQRVALPLEAAIAGLYPGSYLADCYAASLPPDMSGDADALGRMLFSSQPRWVKRLMALRDAVVGGFGIKTSQQLERGGGRLGRVGIFRIYSSDTHEMIVGEDDKHLDFRISILRRDGAGGAREVLVTTAVHCHNRLGRIYITVIRPFHLLIVYLTLRNAMRKG